jgi:predicted RNA-binding Zn ribbon-like protein
MAAPEFLTLADNPALDYMNTIAQGEDGLHEYLQTDGDVVAWLQMMEFLEKGEQTSCKRGTLISAARSLRDVIRKLVIQKKTGKRVDVAALNSFLIHAQYGVRLVRTVDGGLKVTHEYDKSTPERVLTGVAQAAAELLANGDFNLVRKCESPDCVLWFYDRTKAHRRRWCSMSMCGNRHKVANFRARQKSESEAE